MTRSNKRFKKEELSEEEYDDRYEEESFQDEFSDQEGDPVLVARQVSNKVKKEEKEKKIPMPPMINNRGKKPNGETKRTRKFALPWTAAESKTLAMLVNLYGAKEWQFVAKILQSKHNNNRTAAQCSQVC